MQAQVDGRIVRVGLFEGDLPLIRAGQWTFVEVELLNHHPTPLPCTLSVDQFDNDGDVVTSTRQVVLQPGRQPERHILYFEAEVCNGINYNRQIRVRLTGEDGEQVRIRSAEATPTGELLQDGIATLSSEAYLILDLLDSGDPDRRLHHAMMLDADQQAESVTHYRRSVRPLPARALPSQWQGLQGVDAIVWNDGDVSALGELQIQALVDWVRNGGRLLVTAATHWQALNDSSLAEFLPATVEGMEPQTQLPGFCDDLIASFRSDYGEALKAKYKKQAVRVCRLKASAEALPIPILHKHEPIAYSRILGRGMIVLLGASIDELIPTPGEQSSGLFEGIFGNADPKDDYRVHGCERLIAQTLLRLPKQQTNNDNPFRSYNRDLFNEQVRTIEFGASQAAFMGFAIIFAVVYTAGASFGSWWLLKRRGVQHHAWTAYAVFSVLGTIVGVFMVWAIRGFSLRLEQAAVIDARAGENYGYATCLFGVKTPRHSDLDLRLPVGGEAPAGAPSYGPLAPLQDDEQDEQIAMSGASFFTAADEYVCQYAGAGSELLGVPVRATLKQFIGQWHGPLNGSLDASLTARRVGGPGFDFEFGPGSFIRNNLGFDLRSCYLLATDAKTIRPLASQVQCYQLGDLPRGTALESEQILKRLFLREGPDGEPERPGMAPRLTDVIGRWDSSLTPYDPDNRDPYRGRGMALEQRVSPLMLTSVYNFIDQSGDNNRRSAGLTRSYGRSLDCSHWITGRTAVLIGFSETPPPAALEVDRARLRPEKSLTMYRFLIPVERKD